MREASDWIARLAADDVSEFDLASFEHWIDSHPLHASTYTEVYSTWLKVLEWGAGTRGVQRSAD
jgi:ferric-dicitrate binding protein FerR (iron transport regulator)